MKDDGERRVSSERQITERAQMCEKLKPTQVSEDNSFSASWNCCYTFLNFNRRIPGNTNSDTPFGFYSLAVDVQAWSRC